MLLSLKSLFLSRELHLPNPILLYSILLVDTAFLFYQDENGRERGDHKNKPALRALGQFMYPKLAPVGSKC